MVGIELYYTVNITRYCKSLINSRTKRGPNTDPCGIPESTGDGALNLLSTTVMRLLKFY